MNVPWAVMVGLMGVGSLGVLAGIQGGDRTDRSSSLGDLAVDAVSPDAETRRAAIAALRDQGPEGLVALLAAHAARLPRAGEGRGAADSERARLLGAIDAVARQRDAHLSRLYWYTDLAAAKRAASRQGKPILSLRLLGKLDEELSCANSRFFRTVLYANEEVSKLLRERFVLHWQSERPVPKVLIDFGDGRVLRTTLTGNSIHYVLDAAGRPLDALPGLYGPAAFRRGIVRAADLVARAAALAGAAREAAIRSHHQARAKAIEEEFAADVRKFTSAPVSLFTDDPRIWRQIAFGHLSDGRLDETSAAVLGASLPPPREAERAMALTISKAIVETPLMRALNVFQRSIAEDTVRNEYLLHHALHRWFATSDTPLALERLNEQVYAALFRTPRSDPWLGLVPAGAFTGISRETSGR